MLSKWQGKLLPIKLSVKVTLTYLLACNVRVTSGLTMREYSFFCSVVTVCVLFTDRHTEGRLDGRTNRQTDGRLTRPNDINTAELKALSCARNGTTKN